MFLAVFVVRLLVLARLTESPFLLPTQGDMHFYNDWAQRITRGEWTDYRAFYGLPLYAYLLAGLYSLFGFSPFIPGFIQAALEGGTAVLLFKLAGRIFGAGGSAGGEKAQGDTLGHLDRSTGVGLLAAAGWAFYLPAQSYSVILMPTVWLVFVFWWLVWQVVRRSTLPAPAWFLMIGALLGITAMGVATILFLIPLLLAAVVFKWRTTDAPGPKWVHRGAAMLLLALGLALGTSPAWLHNALVARDPVFLSAHSGVNLWIGNNPGANGYPRFPPGLRAGQQAMLKDSITGAEAAVGRPLRRSEVSRYWSDKAKAYIAENPNAWLRLTLAKVANFWNAFQYDDISVITGLREHGVTLPGPRFGVIAALALAGMVFVLPAFPASRWVLAAVLLHMFSLLSVFVTERYRLAAVPGLLLFAAGGLWHLWRALVAQQHARAFIFVPVAIAASWFVSIPRGDAELWALDPYNSGLQALESKRLDVAERKLRFAYAYVPGNAELNFALGNLEVARGNVAAAKSWYAQTFALNPQHEGVLNNLGVLALQEGRAGEAMELFEQAIRVEPADAKTHYLLARAAFDLGDAERALAEIDLALQLQPAQPEFLELRRNVIAKRDGVTPHSR